MSSVAISFLNFFILVGILVYNLKKPTQDYVRNRHKTLRDELQAVQRQLSSAQTRYDEFNDKLKALSAEVAVLNEQAQQDAVAMTDRVIADGKRLAAELVKDARATADGMVGDLKKDLYAQLSEKVLARTEHLLRERLTQDDQSRIQKEFSQQVETFQ